MIKHLKVWKFLKGQGPISVFPEVSTMSDTYYISNHACRIHPYLSLCTQLNSNLMKKDYLTPKREQANENMSQCTNCNFVYMRVTCPKSTFDWHF